MHFNSDWFFHGEFICAAHQSCAKLFSEEVHCHLHVIRSRLQKMSNFQHWKWQVSDLNTYLKPTLSKAPRVSFVSCLAWGWIRTDSAPLLGAFSHIDVSLRFSQLRRVTHERSGTGEMASARVCRKPGTMLERSGTFLSFNRREPLLLPRVRKDRCRP